MLVQARGTLIAVRLVPTSLFLLPTHLSTPPRMSASRRVLLSPFSLLSPLRRDSEYRSGLLYGCAGVSRLAKDIYTRTCVHGTGSHTYGGPVGWPVGRSDGAARHGGEGRYIYEGDFSPLYA